MTRDSIEDVRDEIGMSWGLERLLVLGALGRMGLLKAVATFGDLVVIDEGFLMAVSERLFLVILGRICYFAMPDITT